MSSSILEEFTQTSEECIINEYKVPETVLWYYEFADFINEKDMVNYFHFSYKYEYADVRA